MKQLISSSNLFVMQVEMDVYTAIKKVFAKGPDCPCCKTIGANKVTPWMNVAQLDYNF